RRDRHWRIAAHDGAPGECRVRILAGSGPPSGGCADRRRSCSRSRASVRKPSGYPKRRSEEHTSELQSLAYLVCRLLLEKTINAEHGEHCSAMRRFLGAGVLGWRFDSELEATAETTQGLKAFGEFRESRHCYAAASAAVE